MVMEAVYLRVQKEDAEAQKAAEKQAEIDAFKKNTSALDDFR